MAMAGALIATGWLSLESEREGLVEVGKVLGLALVPALALLVWKRWLVSIVLLVVVSIVALSVTLDVPLTDMRPWSDRDFWGPVSAAGADAFRDMYEARTPFDRLEHPQLAGLLLLAIFGFAATVFLLVTTRQRIWAGLVLVAGVAFPVTVAMASGVSTPLRTGAFVLAAILALLFLSREGERPLRKLVPAVVLGAVVVGVAVGASSSGAVSKEAFVDWRRWDFYDALDDPVAVRYVWSSNYNGIDFPKDETVVLRIRAPKRSVFWRATTLDEYTGYSWEETPMDRFAAVSLPGYPWQVIQSQFGAGAVRSIRAAEFDPLLPAAGHDVGEWTRQHVTVEGLADTHLVAAAEPVFWQVSVDYALLTVPGGPVLQRRGLQPDQEYTVWSYSADVQPKELAELPVADQPELARYLEVLPGIQFPAFGAKSRDATVQELFRTAHLADLRAHEPLYAKAREIVGDTTSPYLAAATLETWFRSSGEFTYDLQPGPSPAGTPPLVDFVLRGKEGYCQHFAGAMALMLRMLGIPARVGAGFVTGAWDARHGEWIVTDHDAHTWVEVYFPKYGWLTFNPTPQRGDLEASYSTTSTSFPDEDVTALGVDPKALSAALLNRFGGLNVGGLPTAGDTGASSGEQGGGIGTGGIVAAVLAALIAAVALIKALRRRLRFIGGGPRRLAAACRRDLVAFLVDQRVAVSPSATLAEIGEVVEGRFSVSPRYFVHEASAARFGPPEGAAVSAQRARRELRALERELSQGLSATDRLRGAFSFRSLFL